MKNVVHPGQRGHLEIQNMNGKTILHLSKPSDVIYRPTTRCELRSSTCINMLRVVLTTNTCCFLTQYWLVGLSGGEALCPV